MREEINLFEGESMVAELTAPIEYISHRDQIAAVTDQRLVFLKKKRGDGYYTIQYLPLSDCTQIRYKRTLAIGSMIGGMILMLTGLSVFFLFFIRLLTSLTVVIWGFPILGLGALLTFGVKRHRLFFQCGERNLHWISPVGGFRNKLPVLEKLRTFAYEKGIIVKEFTIKNRNRKAGQATP